MEEQQQRDELRFGEILSIIWKHIVWILVVSLIAAVACGIFVKYYVDPSKRSYQLSFTIEYPNQYALDKDGNLTDKMLYPDGTPFRVENIIYTDRLQAAKNSDESFENINVEKMINKGKISITVNSSSVYTVSVAANSFKNSEQATAFLKDLCEKSREAIIQKALEKHCLPELADDISYTSEILTERHNDILSTYDKFRSDYRNFEYDGKTLETCYFNAREASSAKVVEETKTLNGMIKALYENKTSFIFKQDSVLTMGGANMIIYAVLVFVVVFLVMSFVFCALDISRKRKGAVKVPAAEEQTSDEQTEPQEPVQEQSETEKE